jgi:hypothetical protein
MFVASGVCCAECDYRVSWTLDDSIEYFFKMETMEVRSFFSSQPPTIVVTHSCTKQALIPPNLPCLSQQTQDQQQKKRKWQDKGRQGKVSKLKLKEEKHAAEIEPEYIIEDGLRKGKLLSWSARLLFCFC